jgi:hypothetical protein
VRLVRRDEIYDSRRRQTCQDLAALPSLPEASRVAAALTEQHPNLAAGRETSRSPIPDAPLSANKCQQEQNKCQSSPEARRKGDPAKPAIAERLGKERTVPIRGIAARVRLGSSRGANARLHRWLREPAAAVGKT